MQVFTAIESRLSTRQLTQTRIFTPLGSEHTDLCKLTGASKFSSINVKVGLEHTDLCNLTGANYFSSINVKVGSEHTDLCNLTGAS